jgi:hypothetical protein
MLPPATNATSFSVTSIISLTTHVPPARLKSPTVSTVSLKQTAYCVNTATYQPPQQMPPVLHAHHNYRIVNTAFQRPVARPASKDFILMEVVSAKTASTDVQVAMRQLLAKFV